MLNNDWKDLINLDDDYKLIINNYFPSKNGKFKMNNDIIHIDIEGWGIEKIYYNIKQDDNNKLYITEYKNFKQIYNIGLLLQIGNWTTFLKMEKYLNIFTKININIYFVLISEVATCENIDYLKEKYDDIVIINAENRGMDIGLFLIALHYMNTNNYNHDYIIKAHTKTNDDFRENVLTNLFGNEKILMNNLKKISQKNIGMVSGSNIYKYNSYKDAFISNFYHLNNMIKYLYNEDVNNDYLEFVAGTFFICKYNIFKILNNNNIEYIYQNLNNVASLDYYWYSMYYNININDKKNIYSDYINNKKERYPNNINYTVRTNHQGLRDCMLEHAMERLFGYICKKNNLDIV